MTEMGDTSERKAVQRAAEIDDSRASRGVEGSSPRVISVKGREITIEVDTPTHGHAIGPKGRYILEAGEVVVGAVPENLFNTQVRQQQHNKLLKNPRRRRK